MMFLYGLFSVFLINTAFTQDTKVVEEWLVENTRCESGSELNDDVAFSVGSVVSTRLKHINRKGLEFSEDGGTVVLTRLISEEGYQSGLAPCPYGDTMVVEFKRNF